MTIMGGFRLLCTLISISLAGIFWGHGSTVYATENPALLPEIAQERTIYEVNPDGTGDFVTIQEGVDSVKSGDTLLIYPGIYKEHVVIEDKTVNLVGIDPQYCILMANSDNYHNIPLTIAAGRVSGLTICGTSVRKDKKDLKENKNIIFEEYDLNDLASIYAWQDQYPGYVVHIDHPYAAEKELCIENCRIISENNYCIGIGCWGGMKMTINNCELISGGESGSIFIHNNRVEMDEAEITVKNSSIRNYWAPYVMAVHSEGESQPVALTFQGVKIGTVAYENSECYSDTNINTWFNINQLENPAVQAMLIENGYLNLSANTQLVHQCTQKQHLEFKKLLEEQSSPLKGWPQLAEGITYWESAADNPIDPKKKRHSIDIKNVNTGIVGNGWCGLTGIYLTEDSYGNTLPEMNYPRTLGDIEQQ